ncbi:MAG: hypothetical protein NZM29_08845 [Nitrospira sp.]|nr:hypothetical protein [Nitrospira sp.]
MKTIGWLLLIISLAGGEVLAQTNAPSILPHGAVVSNVFIAQTALITRVEAVTGRIDQLNVRSNLVVGSTALVTNLNANFLQGKDSGVFAHWVWFTPNSETPPPAGYGPLVFQMNQNGLWYWQPSEDRWLKIQANYEPFEWDY